MTLNQPRRPTPRLRGRGGHPPNPHREVASTPRQSRPLVSTPAVDLPARATFQDVPDAGRGTDVRHALPHGTNGANLVLARLDASDAELLVTLRMASQGQVKSLSDGLDTILGERGYRLSSGEKQRRSASCC